MDRLESWINVLTNIGVIVGLVLVAYQINQTNSALEREFREWDTELTFSTNEMFHNVTTLISENAELWERAIMGEELDGADAIVFKLIGDQWIWAHVNQFNNWERRGFQSKWAIGSVSDQLKQFKGLRRRFDAWIAENGTKESNFVLRVQEELNQQRE